MIIKGKGQLCFPEGTALAEGSQVELGGCKCWEVRHGIAIMGILRWSRSVREALGMVCDRLGTTLNRSIVKVYSHRKGRVLARSPQALPGDQCMWKRIEAGYPVPHVPRIPQELSLSWHLE